MVLVPVPLGIDLGIGEPEIGERSTTLRWLGSVFTTSWVVACGRQQKTRSP